MNSRTVYVGGALPSLWCVRGGEVECEDAGVELARGFGGRGIRRAKAVGRTLFVCVLSCGCVGCWI